MAKSLSSIFFKLTNYPLHCLVSFLLYICPSTLFGISYILPSFVVFPSSPSMLNSFYRLLTSFLSLSFPHVFFERVVLLWLCLFALSFSVCCRCCCYRYFIDLSLLLCLFWYYLASFCILPSVVLVLFLLLFFLSRFLSPLD